MKNMKCSGKCACGNICTVDHETVAKRCACNGIHARPQVGQRWKFDNKEGDVYVAEVVTLTAKDVKVKYVHIMKDSNSSLKVGRQTTCIQLTPNGPITDPDRPRSRRLAWSYLPGQESPTA
jgi:hypothetical protein